jgi:ketol-acid reductoisomerase
MTQDPVPNDNISVSRVMIEGRFVYTVTASNGKAEVIITLIPDDDIETQVFLDTVINRQFSSAMLMEFAALDLGTEGAEQE